jgi:hypothetical protein
MLECKIKPLFRFGYIMYFNFCTFMSSFKYFYVLHCVKSYDVTMLTGQMEFDSVSIQHKITAAIMMDV